MIIKIPTVQEVKTFLCVTSHIESDIDIISGRYKVDGKSIMGMFSLDLSKPLKVEMIEKNDTDKEKFISLLREAGIDFLE